MKFLKIVAVIVVIFLLLSTFTPFGRITFIISQAPAVLLIPFAIIMLMVVWGILKKMWKLVTFWKK